jgi:hypothetical protein
MNSDADHTRHPPGPDTPCRYAIRVEGHLDAHWSAWLKGMTITHEEGGTAAWGGPLLVQSRAPASWASSTFPPSDDPLSPHPCTPSSAYWAAFSQVMARPSSQVAANSSSLRAACAAASVRSYSSLTPMGRDRPSV